MLRFQHSEYLYALILLGLILLLYLGVLAWKQRAIRRLGDRDLVQQLFSGFSRRRYTAKFWLMFAAFALLVLGAANLQMGAKMEKITRKGVDVMIALDVSNSMLAQDVQPSRLDRAKQLVNRLLDRMSNDRIGLVVFAGNAYVQMPLTVDYGAARMYLSTINPSMVPTQGTAIDKAIAQCERSFNQKERKHKAIILVSDGEGWDQGAVDAASKAHEQGVVINAVGVGSSQGAPIRDSRTGEYKKDEKGELVITRMNESLMRSIAAGGHGIYAHLDNTGEVADNLTAKLDAMQKKEYGENIFTDYNSYFQYFLAAALLLLLAEFFVPETRKKTALPA